MANLRFEVVAEAFNKKPVEVITPIERPSEFFGKNVFNRAKMYKYLPREVYEKLVDVIDNGARLDRSIADAVAKGMKQWADENGDLGPVYGHQWRSWPDYKGGTIDQIQNVLDQLRNHPDSRRMIVSAWNPAEVDDMALPPCHCLFQFYVADGKLSLQLYQRSADTFLGVPFNIASYALLLQMMAQVTGFEVGEFIHTTGDTHLYLNHLDQARLQLTRTPRPLPRMKINPDVKDLFSFRYEDFELEGYDPWPHIAATVSV